MKTTKRIHHSFGILHSAFCIAAMTSLMSAAFAADVSDVIVRQQWPWSTDIKVEFKLFGVSPSAPVTVNVEAFDGDTPLDSSNLKAAIVGDLWGITESGVHTFVIKPAVAFGTERNAIADFKVRLSLTDAPANAADILYKIVDLDPPYAVTDVRRRDFYNGKYGSFVTNFSDIATGWTTSLDDVLIWTGVTEDDTYKTSKMVFRRIPAAGKSFQFQKGIAAATNAYYTAGEGIKVSFSKDYYIGVFEVTQAQVMKIASGATYDMFNFTNSLYSATRPAERIVFNRYNDSNKNGNNFLAIRSRDAAAAYGGLWPIDTSHRMGGTYFATTSIANQMQSKTGLLVDAPTEAMWEYACRAGTDTYKYSGATGTMAYNDGFSPKVMRAYNINGSGGNSWSRNGDVAGGTKKVGQLKPNAWGLYDMLGNVEEWCLDHYVDVGNLWKQACYSGEDNVDPIGPASTSTSVSAARVTRGRNWRENSPTTGSMFRQSRGADLFDSYVGVRLCIYLTVNADGTL